MNDKSPFFSIIIPTYNREKSIVRAIESILCQTFIDFEIIIIDDASTDNTQTVISSFIDDHIIYSRNNENKESVNILGIPIFKRIKIERKTPSNINAPKK